METSTTTAAHSGPVFRSYSIAFLVALLLFLLPFVNIRCNGRDFASNTGLGLALGANYKTVSQLNAGDKNVDREITVTEKQSGKMYISCLIALLLGVAGLVLSLSRREQARLTAMIGLLAALALIVLMIQIRYDIGDRSHRPVTTGLDTSLKVTAEFTAWYYLSVLSFIVAAFLSYPRKPVSG